VLVERNLAEMVEDKHLVANLWAEWAKVKLQILEKTYKLPKLINQYAGIIVSLSASNILASNTQIKSKLVNG
jgi:hypothetical protein